MREGLPRITLRSIRATMPSTFQPHPNLVPFGCQLRAKRPARFDHLGERVSLVREPAQIGLVAIVMAHELERRGFDAVAGADTRHHADPAIVPASAMARMEREAAESIKDRPPPIDLHGQRIMRTMTDHDVGASINCRVGDLL